jgi:predicted SAM-dependent methyltransferase
MSKVPETLKEWYRILKPGGKLILQVPNFDYVARYWLTGPDRVWAEQMVFGLQSDSGQFHKCAFTSAMLKGDLEGCGFIVERVEYRWTHNQETLQAVAKKPLHEITQEKKESCQPQPSSKV